IALAVLSLLPIGICMGMPYPLGLRAIASENDEGLAWVWAVNAAASVLGSIVAFALAMVVGFRIVLLLGATCYLGAILSACWVVSAKRTTKEEPVRQEDLEPQLTV